MKIPFLDFKRQYQRLKPEIDQAVQDVLESGWYILGKQVEAFEHEWAEYCGARYSVGVATGTDALMLALLASGAIEPGRGDEVITSPLTAAYTALAVIHAGARPVFADIDPATFNISPRAVEATITERTRAVIPVHLYGQVAAMNEILKIAEQNNLTVIEDACQAHGASLFGKRAGTLGAAAAFSFYPTKNLGAFGDGGIIVSNDERIIARARRLRQGGQVSTYISEEAGYNSRLDEVQAAILRIKLRHLDEWNQERRRLAGIYRESLKNKAVALPAEIDNAGHVYHLFVIRCKERDRLRQFLATCGIQTLIHYPVPLHQQPAFMRYFTEPLPEAESASQQILSLPLYPGLTDEEAVAVAQAVNDYRIEELSRR